jgi:hypothetical protein
MEKTQLKRFATKFHKYLDENKKTENCIKLIAGIAYCLVIKFKDDWMYKALMQPKPFESIENIAGRMLIVKC